MTFSIDRPELFAALGVLVALLRYGTYIHSIFRGRTRPHIFSWLNWSLMVGIGAAAQYRLGAGPSVIVLACVSVFCFLIAIIAFFRGEKNITRSDWVAFIGALLAIPVWEAARNPLGELVLLMAIDVFCYYPTLRKSRLDPWSEGVGSLFWSGLRYFLAMLAARDLRWSEMIYPFWLMAADWAFMLYIVWLRRRVAAHPPVPANDPAII